MKRLLGMIVSALAFVIIGSGVPTAIAQSEHVVRGPERGGGEIQLFLDRVKTFRAENVRVVIEDVCISACTLYTSLIPDGLVCARPGARLVFHRPVLIDQVKVDWNMDGTGIIRGFRIKGPMVGAEADRFWLTYPLSVRKRIMQSSGVGLPPHGQELTIPARELVPAC